MALTVPSADRITNKYSPPDPTDKSMRNADNIMVLADSILNGKNETSGTVYRFRVAGYTMTTRPETGSEGELIFMTDIKQFQGWNGDEWVTIG